MNSTRNEKKMYRYNCIIFQTGAGQARAATAAEDALHLLGRVRAPGQELIQNQAQEGGVRTCSNKRFIIMVPVVAF